MGLDPCFRRNDGRLHRIVICPSAYIRMERQNPAQEAESPAERLGFFLMHLPVTHPVVVGADDFPHALCLRTKGGMP